MATDHLADEGIGTPTPPFAKGGPGGIPHDKPPLTLKDYAPHLKPYARRLRARQTEAEQKLWFHLRRDQLGVRLHRQRPLGRYIVDFYAPTARLVIELDGGQHFEAEHRQRDAQRDDWLRGQGLTVLRFDDRQVLLETAAVLEVILGAVQQAISGGRIPPSPPFAKGGETAASAERPPPLEKREETPPETETSPLCKRGDRGDSTTTVQNPPNPCASYSSPTPSTA